MMLDVSWVQIGMDFVTALVAVAMLAFTFGAWAYRRLERQIDGVRKNVEMNGDALARVANSVAKLEGVREGRAEVRAEAVERRVEHAEMTKAVEMAMEAAMATALKRYAAVTEAEAS